MQLTKQLPKILSITHLVFVVIIFLAVQSSTDGQAGFAWFPFFFIDYPVGYLLYEPLSNNELMQGLVEYWYTVGNNQGPNIRAFIIYGIFGTLYWYAIGWLIKIIIVKIKANKALKRDSAKDAAPLS